jgi:hypothetical protein
MSCSFEAVQMSSGGLGRRRTEWLGRRQTEQEQEQEQEQEVAPGVE